MKQAILTSFLLKVFMVMLLFSTMTMETPVEAYRVTGPEYSLGIEEVKLKPEQEPLMPTDVPAPALSNDFIIKRSPHKELLEANNDYVGWIQIDGTIVNYPIVKGRDNDFYLNRNFEKEIDKRGSIYMDYRNIGFGFSPQVILYGHNMKNGEMFGELSKYKDPDFAKAHPTFTISDLYGTRTYQVYSSYFASADPSYITTGGTVEDLTDLIRGQLASSDMAYAPLPASYGHVVTLVTCTYEVDDGRYFLHAVEILEN